MHPSPRRTPPSIRRTLAALVYVACLLMAPGAGALTLIANGDGPPNPLHGSAASLEKVREAIDEMERDRQCQQ